MKYCRHCQKVLPNNATRCPLCKQAAENVENPVDSDGNEIPLYATYSVPPQPVPRNKTGWIVGLSILGFFLIIGIFANLTESNETLPVSNQSSLAANSEPQRQTPAVQTTVAPKTETTTTTTTAPPEPALADGAWLEAHAEEYNSGLTYEDLARSPDKYEGEAVIFTGKVIDVNDPGLFTDLTTLLIFTKSNTAFGETYYFDDIIYAKIRLLEGEDRIIEGDVITFYGVSDGLTTYTNVTRASKTVPKIEIDKYVLNK